MFLARKITRSKWDKEGFSDGEIPADAVTADLRTKENKLSFWKCGKGTVCEVEEAALALAAAAERVEKLEIAWVSTEDLRADGQRIDPSEGRTPVSELIGRHVDVSLLDYARLGKLAHRFVSAMKEEQYMHLTKRGVTDLLANAVGQRRVELSDLKDKVRREVSRSLERGAA